MTDRNSVLDDCPFCGSDQLKIAPNVYSGLLRVQCEGCWATSVASNRRSIVIAAWNRRALKQKLHQAAAHLCAFDWESATSPASADLNARILALRAELDR